MSSIEVRGLRKRYGDLEAVSGIDFAVPEGAVFSLLGPNGAGKTTTVEILEGHRERSGGEVSVLGFDPQTGGRAFRERIGIVLQEAGVDDDLSVRETVSLYAGFYPNPRSVDEVIELVGLMGKRRARTKTLSGGQRRRLDLALGLIGNPDLLFLDEPTTGFDPSARRSAWRMLADLRSLGKTIFLTSHYMDEVQALADHVVVLSGGEIVAEGTPESLVSEDIQEAEIRFALPPGASLADLPAEARRLARLERDTVVVHTTRPTRVLHALSTWSLARGEELPGLRVTRPSLEDVYLQLTETDDDTNPMEEIGG